MPSLDSGYDIQLKFFMPTYLREPSMPQGRKTNVLIYLSPEERRVFESWQRSSIISHGLAKRGKIILMLSEGASISEISRTIGIGRGPIYVWAERFQNNGIDGLKDKPGRGRRPYGPSTGCRASLGDSPLEETRPLG